MHTPFPIETLPERVVSLVPSMTESMFELGLGSRVVGCTDCCVYPKNGVERLAKVGGPKNINTDLVIQMQPALVLANQEENNWEDIKALEEHGIPVWGAFPLSVRDAMDDLWGLAGLFQSDQAARIIRSLEDSLDWAMSSAINQVEISYFCPIWKEIKSDGEISWTTFNQNTYMGDLLSLFGGKNIFGEMQQGNTEDEKKKRYPIITDDQILGANPNMIILPDEPYLFADNDRQSILNIYPTSQTKQIPTIKMVKGETIMWYGTHIAKAFDILPQIFTI